MLARWGLCLGVVECVKPLYQRVCTEISVLAFPEKKQLESTLGKMLLLFIVSNCLCVKVTPTSFFFCVGLLIWSGLITGFDGTV